MKINITGFSAVVSDIDYTLVDFGKGHRVGIEVLAQLAGRQFADEINRIFHLVLEGLRRGKNVDWNDRPAFQEVISQMQRLQAPALTTYGLKPWSRESWMILVAKNYK